jgi:hypothetical protein
VDPEEEDSRLRQQIAVLAGALALFLAFSGCREPSEPEITEPFSDMNDLSTTAVVTNLVQIETGGTMKTAVRWAKACLSVTDQEGVPLQNFNHFNFSVVESTASSRFEVASEQLTVKTVEETGLATASAMVMDYTIHMPESLKGDAENAVKLFIFLMKSGDVAEIIKYADYPYVAQIFTSDKDLLTTAVEDPWGGAGGRAALIDAVYQAILDASEREELKAVYTIGLGWEEASQHTLAELFELADATNVPCYGFVFEDGDTLTVKEIADYTGGRLFYIPSLDEPEKIYELLSGMLKRSYVVEWQVKSSSGSEVALSITTDYTCGNGALTSTATGIFTAP